MKSMFSMKMLFLLLTAMLSGIKFSIAQNIFTCRNVAISFFSSAPIENISAQTNKAVSAINMQTGAVYFKIPIRTFQFPKSLMQEHFNTDYLESDKYPFAEFNGNITDYKRPEQDGKYRVSIEGKLTLHGITKSYKEQGVLEVKDGKVTAASTFKVRLADHHIKIPTIVFKNIAEVVDVKVNAVYLPQNNVADSN